MSLSIATSISTTPLFQPGGDIFNYQAILGIAIFTVSRIQTGSYLGPFENRRKCLQVAKSGVLRLSAQILPIDRRRPIEHSTRMQSASAICAAALSARSAASVEEQTQTIKHKARTITNIPEKNLTKPYDGGSGFPPGGDDGFRRGGRGSGDKSSGGLTLLGILGILGYLKDLETRKIKKKIKTEQLDRDDAEGF